ncbi:PepSY-associated TM helix domain-containing protein [Piscinibacter sp. XHJ-5]|uniref:PepSY-associated TM helix domain-containing protein n=1 Tax=Piscinibacter sp. XHJ-5 TaxID=3037797 RepID=UPI002452B375|nr:PepSY-associated TM helix domain-containing protein [Piscinibacter sp. XHJ-5]
MDSRIDSQRRAYWLRTLHQWHWISAAACLLGMLLFSVTGITLNHASQIEARPQVTGKAERLPAALVAQLTRAPAGKRSAPLPDDLRRWLAERWALEVGPREAEWSPEEIYLALPRPGGDAWLRIARVTGEAEYESTDRGWISYLNDLHKGRHTGTAWRWFIDLFAGACLVFSVTGLLILKMRAGHRPGTWPLVGFGVVLPLLLALIFIH